MKSLRLVAVLLFSSLLPIWAPANAHAEDLPCGYIHATSYEPVVTGCYDWLVIRYPNKPVSKAGRWVIEDDGLEFTLMYNSGTTEWKSKDQAIIFFKKTGRQVRFGVAQPFDGREPTSEYLEHTLGIYVESGYTGDWVQWGLPQGH